MTGVGEGVGPVCHQGPAPRNGGTSDWLTEGQMIYASRTRWLTAGGGAAEGRGERHEETGDGSEEGGRARGRQKSGLWKTRRY